MSLANWDNKIRLGVWPFSVEIEKNTRLYFIVADHDTGYQMIADGIADFTLKELDWNFLKNGLFYAASLELWIDKISVAKQFWIAYRACRAWAKYVRPELEAYRPKNKMGKGDD